MWGGNSSSNTSNDDPFRDLDNIVRRFFGPESGMMHGSPFGGANMRGSFLSTSSRGNWLPAMNLLETHSEYQLSADTSGLKREDMEVNVKDNRVCIKGSRRDDVAGLVADPGHQEQHAQTVYHMYERGMGSFERCVTLPSKILEDSVAAKLVDGVLTVTMMKEQSGANRGSPINIR